MENARGGLGPCEMWAGRILIRLDGRAVELWSSGSDWTMRHHVDQIGFEAATELDRKGRVRVNVGRLQDGELNLGSGRVRLEL